MFGSIIHRLDAHSTLPYNIRATYPTRTAHSAVSVFVAHGRALCNGPMFAHPMPEQFHPQITVAVCGAGRADTLQDALAEEVGRRLALAGAALICGGLGGVMAAACRGARAAGGLTIGVLPGGSRRDANPDVQVAIATGMGQGRNLLIVQTADVVIAVGGEYGTLSEIALARKLGRAVIGLETWDIGDGHVIAAGSPEEAVSLALAHALR